MNICLYGAASASIDPAYLAAAEALGRSVARRGHCLVFGAGATGIMGAAARGVRAEDGTLIGVAPRFFDRSGVLYGQCTELIFTETMRQRKETMERRADAFLMAPGGIGTMEEFFEILTLKQLGRHSKPIGVWNLRGYYDGMQAMLQAAVSGGFLEREGLSLFCVEAESEVLLDRLEASYAAVS